MSKKIISNNVNYIATRLKGLLENGKDKGVSENQGKIQNWSPNNIRRIFLGTDGVAVQTFVQVNNRNTLQTYLYKEQDLAYKQISSRINNFFKVLVDGRVYSNVEEIVVVRSSADKPEIEFNLEQLLGSIPVDQLQRLKSIIVVNIPMNMKNIMLGMQSQLSQTTNRKTMLSDMEAFKDNAEDFTILDVHEDWYNRSALRPHYYEMDIENGTLDRRLQQISNDYKQYLDEEKEKGELDRSIQEVDENEISLEDESIHEGTLSYMEYLVRFYTIFKREDMQKIYGKIMPYEYLISDKINKKSKLYAEVVKKVSKEELDILNTIPMLEDEKEISNTQEIIKGFENMFKEYFNTFFIIFEIETPKELLDMENNNNDQDISNSLLKLLMNCASRVTGGNNPNLDYLIKLQDADMLNYLKEYKVDITQNLYKQIIQYKYNNNHKLDVFIEFKDELNSEKLLYIILDRLLILCKEIKSYEQQDLYTRKVNYKEKGWLQKELAIEMPTPISEDLKELLEVYNKLEYAKPILNDFSKLDVVESIINNITSFSNEEKMKQLEIVLQELLTIARRECAFWYVSITRRKGLLHMFKTKEKGLEITTYSIFSQKGEFDFTLEKVVYVLLCMFKDNRYFHLDYKDIINKHKTSGYDPYGVDLYDDRLDKSNNIFRQIEEAFRNRANNK